MPSTSWICGSVCSTKFFGLTAAQDQDRALAAARASRPARCAAVSLTSRDHVEREPVALERLGRHVHADRASRPATRCRSARRTRTPPRAATAALSPSASSRVAHVLAARGSGTRRCDIGALELGPADDLAEERVGVEQHVVVEEDVVDAHHALVAQLDVVGLRGAAVHRAGRGRSGCRGRGSRRSRRSSRRSRPAMSGMSALMPSPAGVSAPVTVSPTVTSGSSIFLVNRRHGLAQARGVVGEERAVDQLRDRLAPVIGVGSMRVAAQVAVVLLSALDARGLVGVHARRLRVDHAIIKAGLVGRRRRRRRRPRPARWLRPWRGSRRARARPRRPPRRGRAACPNRGSSSRA